MIDQFNIFKILCVYKVFSMLIYSYYYSSCFCEFSAFSSKEWLLYKVSVKLGQDGLQPYLSMVNCENAVRNLPSYNALRQSINLWILAHVIMKRLIQGCSFMWKTLQLGMTIVKVSTVDTVVVVLAFNFFHDLFLS